MDSRYSYNKNIVNIVKQLEEENSNTNTTNTTNPLDSNLISLLYKDKKHKINRGILTYKSNLFRNYTKILQESTLYNNSVNTNTSTNTNNTIVIPEDIISEETFNTKFLTYINSISSSENNNISNSKIQIPELIELLELSLFLQIHHLTSIIESILEKIISIDNALCLIQIAEDYNLYFLKQNILMYLVVHHEEAKNKSVLKYLSNISSEVKEEYRKMLSLNSK